MSHICGRSSSEKDRNLNVFQKKFKTTDKNCCLGKKSTTDFKFANYNSKTDGQHRAKRLKTHKERSQMRGCWKEASRLKSYHHHCHCRRSKDIPINGRCCQTSCHCSSMPDAPLSNVVPATQEPSIITDSRLIGHHGLFNHEVKSIDIERLLSKQRKMEKSKQQVHENNSTSLPYSSLTPTPVSSNDVLGAEVVTLHEEVEPVAKAHDDFQLMEDKLSQGSDVIPMQKISPVMSEKGAESQLTPTDGREIVMTQKQDSPIHQSQPHGMSKSPLELPSSDTPERSVSQRPSKDPSTVSDSVRAVAASLCGCLKLPVLRRRNLVAESREVLLEALQERHGPWLRQNLSQLKGYLSSGFDHSKEVQDQELTTKDEDELRYTDSFPTEFRASKPFFNSQKNKSFRRKGRTPNLQLSPLLLSNPQQTHEWFRKPEETSTSVLDDILRPPPSAQFCMDFGPSKISDHLFAPSPVSCWEERNSQLPHWGHSLSRQISQETFIFDSFENRLMNQTRALIGSQYTVSNTQNFSPHQAKLQERHSAESMHFPQETDAFGVGRHSFASSFSSQVQRPAQIQGFQPFSQISQPSACPLPRPHPTDMIHYPPSHVLERERAPSRSSLLSPEHWTFPPMRLY
ncbi:proline-rich protein 19 [Halichoeres trimaculatus]|uniref:proline-rich protein 19 n=1 Tax=Halichoeres trimaculatus TaxID=147232 RepID=UPI003D9DB269